ncbi:MAG TPA: TetR/AcrR family transcriptional regulator [Solirubrobacteraceae bacterium]|jgi:AcrR family transcriptional regulator|nr:TetR/AcrR family transcriptional regulator [Solirubrobacteraceae bacterium]
MAQISHREQLLQGAIECLRTKGYSRTTARDIAAAAGANLASIGYHFGSKEALLNEAIMRTCDQWTERLGEAAFSGGANSPLDQMSASWVAMRESFDELRPVLVGLIEAVAQSAWSDELRDKLAAHYLASRERVAAMVRQSLGEELERDGVDPRVVASFLIAVCDGLVLQWLLDPDQTPSGEQLASSLGAALTRAMSQASLQG